MDESVIIVMLKDEKTGFLDKELFSARVAEHGGLLEKVYVTREDGGFYAQVFVSTGRDVEDWQFNALYDYYDESVWDGAGDFHEEKDAYNPTWRVSFVCAEDGAGFDQKLADVLALHNAELVSTFLATTEKREEYI
jgi:hypothetical protein